MTVRLVSAVAAALLAAGCVMTYPYEGSFAIASVGAVGALSTTETTRTESADAELSETESGWRVADSARAFVGRTRLTVDGRRFNYDCSGTILAIYYDAGIDLLPEFQVHSGNGVSRLHGIAETHRLLYAPKLPQPGDIIFWDNTYDRNGDGRWNDELTHAGVVISVSDDGQVEYVHHNYTRGIVIERMNLFSPDTHTGDAGLVNSPMRMRSHRHMNPSAWLASHLYRASARLYQL